MFGTICVVYGMSIYYLLPMALLSNNYSLMLDVFFAILLGMIFGLTLVSYNLQGLLEVIILKLFLFWEKESLKTLVLKNLVAHK
jgi:hypothetical protein